MGISEERGRQNSVPEPTTEALSPSRRRFLQAAALGAAGFGLVAVNPRSRVAKASARGDLTVTRIERMTVKLSFREIPAKIMARELPHWIYSEIIEVELASGQLGHGETLLYYTFGVPDDNDVARVQGRNAAEVMWDDSLGAGLQMALFDAVARAIDVPIHNLLGNQVHETTPVGWWNIDMPPEDWVAECQTAIDQGYKALKTKGRPWFDNYAQVEAIRGTIPDWFKVGIDFNDCLLDAERGIPVLRELAQAPQVGIFETPIPQRDLEGNVAITDAIETPIALHYGTPPPVDVIKYNACDGYVIGGGASRVMRQGTEAALADRRFWLQIVGSSVTAAWSLHFGSVLEKAAWPAVNCHQLFNETLLDRPIVVEDGRSQVPTGPGLGFEIDMDLVRRLQIDKPTQRPDPPRLIVSRWPDGPTIYTANNGRVNFMLTEGMRGTYPYFRRGVTTELAPNDGSERWQALYEKARRDGPVVVNE